MIPNKPTEFSFAQATALIKRLSENMTAEEITAHLWPYVENVGIERFREGVVKELVALTGPGNVVPDRYRSYRALVHDGIAFLLANLSPKRLLRLAVDQMLMPDVTGAEQRLVKLAGQIPTLHKLGQTLARNRNVDPVFREWLISLENGVGETPMPAIRDKVQGELNVSGTPLSVELDEAIHSEASVGEVVGFTWTARDSEKKCRGVFKVLKLGIMEKLQEEFGILHDLDPEFDLDGYLTVLIKDLFVEELPKRWVYLSFPYLDNSMNYKNPVSNGELQLFIFRFLANFLEKKVAMLSEMTSGFAMSALKPLGCIVRSFALNPRCG